MTTDEKRLVLFDIDGTLISTNGIAKDTFSHALEQVFQKEIPARSHDFAGKTDRQILKEIIAKTAIPEDHANEKAAEVFDFFFTLLRTRLTADRITVHEGIREILATLSNMPGITLALLTGNMIRGAEIKLTPPGLYGYFSFGAFGDDGINRDELPDVAVERALRLTGKSFTGKEVVIIGDTPNDIQCGRHLNVRSIAVATGGASYDTLSKYSPDFLFHDLSDNPNVIDAILCSMT